jgi:hypothetical protein
MLNRSSRPMRNCKPGLRTISSGWCVSALFLVLILLVCIVTSARAEPFVAIVDPSFYRAPVSEPIQGTTSTVIAYYRIDGDNLVPAKSEEIPTLDRTLVKKQTLVHARFLLKNLSARSIRDSQGTVIALILESPDPTLSSILLLPELSQQFEEVLGPDCLVAVPNRHTLFLFPRLANKIQSFAGTVLNLYHNDPWPVSTEIFALKNGSLSVTDHFNEDL